MSQPKNADAVIARLENALALLDPWRGHPAPLPAEAVPDLRSAYATLTDVQRDLPGATAWCVIKHYAGASEHWSPVVWPFMAFSTRERAEEWADFLDDFYGPGDRWVVEETAPDSAAAHSRDDDRPVGEGYFGSDRSGRGPMERWFQDARERAWHRLDGHERCDSCRGSGYVPDPARTHRYIDCPACENYGWVKPEETA